MMTLLRDSKTSDSTPTMPRTLTLRPLLFRPLGLLAALFWFGACSEESTVVPSDDDCPPNCPSNYPELTVGEPAHFALEGLEFDVTADGTLRGATTDRDPHADNVYLASIAGLWIGAEVAGEPRGNLTWSGGSDGASNYVTKTEVSDGFAPRQLGPFVITEDHLLHPDLDWPKEAPIDKDGNPHILGDQMVWHCITSDTLERPGEFAAPLEGLKVNQMFFGLRETGFENVIFCRWDITNESDAAWENAHVGFYSDTDLAFEGSGAFSNRAGYAEEHDLGFIYSSTAEAEQFASGIAFIQTPIVTTPRHYATSHRIMRKNATPPIEFSEYGFDRPEQILWALRGLSNDGDPMIDPLTEESTPYAYTGDPDTNEGWIDDANSDIRQMIGSGPFTLGPGETESVLGAWILGWGEDRSDALARVRITLDQVHQEAYRIYE